MQRIHSIDMLRGLIMVLMAIDHVRVYAGVPAGGPSSDLFLTRWVTHFCAPGFAFLAGTGIYFRLKKHNDRKQLSRFLVGRGLLLVFLELTVIRFCWTLNFNYGQFVLAGVIWMLGWCMVLMAIFIRLKPLTVGIVGVVIIGAQKVFHYVPQLLPPSSRIPFIYFWNFIYPSGPGFETISVLYVIVPWIGVMMAGYGFGLIMVMEKKKRDRICLIIGLSFVALFVILGGIFIYANPVPNNDLPFLWRLLSQNKYPASPLFLLMTLGPIIALVPVVEKVKGWFSYVLEVFGNVPMFYYLMHIPLIHLCGLVVNYFRDGDTHQSWYVMAPFYTQQPEGIRWSLWLLYLVWIIVIAVLYVLCSWYTKYKKRHPENRWLRYL